MYVRMTIIEYIMYVVWQQNDLAGNICGSRGLGRWVKREGRRKKVGRAEVIYTELQPTYSVARAKGIPIKVGLSVSVYISIPVPLKQSFVHTCMSGDCKTIPQQPQSNGTLSTILSLSQTETFMSIQTEPNRQVAVLCYSLRIN